MLTNPLEKHLLPKPLLQQSQSYQKPRFHYYLTILQSKDQKLILQKQIQGLKVPKSMWKSPQESLKRILVMAKQK